MKNYSVIPKPNLRWSAILVTLTIMLSSRLALSTPDIAKVMGPVECGECHTEEVNRWRESQHYKTFKELPRRKKAKEITKALGIKRIKKGSDCVGCHFTQQIVEGQAKVVSGISCESCHSPAKDWIDIHNDYGGKDVKKDQETAEHKSKRIADSLKAGMIVPSDLYTLANNCYGCHLVPNEKLVNKGGHKAGSAFELVSWSQGEVRHNFYSSPTGKENVHASAERKRMMYVIGNVMELEHALRALSKATEKDKFAVTMAKRIKLAAKRLKKITGVQPISEMDNVIAIVDAARLKLNNESALSQAAEKIAAIGKQFAKSHDGSQFSALDTLIPGPDKYKGR